MILTLVIVGRDGIALGSKARKTFRATGGSIGRLRGNDLVLDDPHVSRRHAEIRCANGRFYIVDMSVNGVFVSSPSNRLVRDEPYEIKSDDVILIGPYEIRASITGEPVEDPSGPLTIGEPFGSSDATALPWSDSGPVPPQPPVLGADPSPRSDPGAPDRPKAKTSPGEDADDQ
jgi:type VI secretion system protein ImpI